MVTATATIATAFRPLRVVDPVGFGKEKGRSQDRPFPFGRTDPPQGLPARNGCCADATVPEHLACNRPSACPRRFFATPLHEIIAS
jgi:hypothetical protein